MLSSRETTKLSVGLTALPRSAQTFSKAAGHQIFHFDVFAGEGFVDGTWMTFSVCPFDLCSEGILVCCGNLDVGSCAAEIVLLKFVCFWCCLIFRDGRSSEVSSP